MYTAFVNLNNKSNELMVRAFSDSDFKSKSSPFVAFLETVIEAYYACITNGNKGNSTSATDFRTDWYHNCYQLAEDIWEGRYEISKSICFIINIPVKREIFAANFRDRIVHWWIILRAYPIIEGHLYDCMMSNRVGKGNLAAITKIASDIKEFSSDYTTDAWIYKFDLQGFFMGIDKRILKGLLIPVIEKEYQGDYKDILLGLISKVIMHCPQYKCERRSPMSEWVGLPKNKSLFGQDRFHGLPIGNLTSQIFALFLLSYVVKMVLNAGAKVTEFVDDFCAIFRMKEELLEFIPPFREYLKNDLKITLHPKKQYIQHYSKGVNIIGATIKKGRTYISNRTVRRCEAKVKYFCSIPNKIKKLPHFSSVVNSYFGIMRHHSAYKIRKMIGERIMEDWGEWLYFNNDYQKCVVKKQYTEKQTIINSIKLCSYKS